MTPFNKLVLNEHIKQFKRGRGIVLLGVIFFLNLAVAIGLKFTLSDTNFTFWDYLNVSTYLIYMLNFLTVIIAGDIVSGEFSQGTVKSLLTRPISRFKILKAKYATVLLSVGYVIGLHLLLAFCFGLLFFYSTVLEMNDGVLLNVLLKYIFGAVEMMVYASFTMLLSIVTRRTLFSVSFSMFFLLAIKLFLVAMSELNIVQFKYLLFANTNLSQYYFGSPLFPGMTLTFSISVILIHMILFIVISVLSFVRKDV
ncbi:hypothetical protein N781_09730 [Pontibacillus halophilus JSM 076056 = DSM 19796]|uniref:ABC transporter permease n=1 Tax=Pontibacillus halophilus JSM 076056 = DSM 19796 TaxID=1385510 RepID=A0A0A5G9F5_9BACI|nr:ABC transporter permease [Pontibacillus halophilus]KGX88669.1 hypothetical protein N781_09730 [Pontibacillus halophilus JSM 076056 = DSM 19796]